MRGAESKKAAMFLTVGSNSEPMAAHALPMRSAGNYFADISFPVLATLQNTLLASLESDLNFPVEPNRVLRAARICKILPLAQSEKSGIAEKRAQRGGIH